MRVHVCGCISCVHWRLICVCLHIPGEKRSFGKIATIRRAASGDFCPHALLQSRGLHNSSATMNPSLPSQMLALPCARARTRQERKALKATQQQAMLNAQAGAAPMHLRPAKTKMERSEEEEAAAAAMLSSPGRSSNPGSGMKKRRTDGSPADYGMSCFTGVLFACVCWCVRAPSLQMGTSRSMLYRLAAERGIFASFCGARRKRIWRVECGMRCSRWCLVASACGAARRIPPRDPAMLSALHLLFCTAPPDRHIRLGVSSTRVRGIASYIHTP